MKKLFALLFTAFTIAGASAADRITLLITVTNAPTTNGMTLVVNAVTRTWQTNASATTIATNATKNGSATNLFNHLAAFPFASMTLQPMPGTNQVQLIGNVGQAMVASAAGNWATLSLSTQTVTTLVAVRVPISSEPTASQRTNIANGLVRGINDFSSQPFTNIVGYLSRLSAPKLTNGINFGNAFSSPGSGTSSESFGANAGASGDFGLAVGNGAAATAKYSVALGYLANVTAPGTNGLALGIATSVTAESAQAVGNGASATALNASSFGFFAAATGTNSTAIGNQAAASQEQSIALGQLASAAHANAIAIGTSAATTATNQVRLGDSSYSVSVPGTLNVTGTSTLGTTTAKITNSTFAGTIYGLTNGVLYGTGLKTAAITNATFYQTNSSTGIWAYTRANNTSLANGNNAGVDFGTAVLIKIKAGPTAAFAICGIAGGQDGRIFILHNSIAQNMTIANDSGVDPVPANRILTQTGADISTTGIGVVGLHYDSEDSRWIVDFIQQ